MTQPTTHSAAARRTWHDELAGRTLWTLATIGELVRAGRAARWLPGDATLEVGDAQAARAHLEATVIGPTPMRTLAARLALTASELDLLWLLACVELDPGLTRVAQLLVSPGMSELDAQIVERLAGGHDRLPPDAFERLARLGLIEVPADPRIPLPRRTIRASDRVLDLARGRCELDRELASLATLEPALEVRRQTARLELARAPQLDRAVSEEAIAVVTATGIEGSGRATLLRHAIASSGRCVLAIDAGALASEPAAMRRRLRAVARECRLHGAWPVLVGADAVRDHLATIDHELLRDLPVPVFATALEPLAWTTTRTQITVPVALPDASRRRRLWSIALGTSSAALVERCAQRYTITPALVARAAATAAATLGAGTPMTIDHVHEALRHELEPRVLGLATRIETAQTWDDLVLPIDQIDLVAELVARARRKHVVLEQWGFADKIGKGCGLTALLSGPPGTGKTMIAGLIARELGLDLYQVDLSRVVSKYIGETEKQLASLFDAAESGQAILLFDEADALFGKRSEINSSNDRYANLEVNYLLQRIEAFTGIAMLTTNHETAIDEAFKRRLAVHLRVPLPDEPQRRMLWEAMLPERAARTGDLDLAPLAAQFVMSGGYIKNAMLRAAYLAADEERPIDNAHVWRAARAEYEAMGKISHTMG